MKSLRKNILREIYKTKSRFISILAIIVLISVPTLSKTIKNSEEKQYQVFLDNLYVATETYLLSNDELIENLNQTGYLFISLN